MARIATLLVFLMLCASVALFGMQFSPGEWYLQLRKPEWTPPNSWFGPVWTVLYVLIAVSGWRLWHRRNEAWARSALCLWFAQLLANALWSWLFFGLRWMGVALVDLSTLWLLIVIYLLWVWPRDRLTAVLFVPYLLWVSLAAALNAAIWWMNT